MTAIDYKKDPIGGIRDVLNLLMRLGSIVGSEVAATAAADHAFTYPTRAIIVTGAGDFTMRLAGDSTDIVITGAVASLTPLPYSVSHIRMGATATVIGLY